MSLSMGKTLFVSAVLILLLVGCDTTGGVVSGSSPNISGAWSGAWQDSSGSGGELELFFFSGESGPGPMNVSLITKGASCGQSGQDSASGSQTAMVVGNDVDFSVRFGSCPAGSGDPNTWGGVFVFNGSIRGDLMSGSYTLQSTHCTCCMCAIGSSGSWDASR